ncbi:cilia- and flagella-associated protein 54-like isoform X2 [Biomphalaria glabrata]|uniref:Cilia- and flagella-associated protein 54-like isoform X2 n=1 Tax=Biomphalaria glabrata TaxID=6526 RepID=A0A9W3A969_BIOGL|nr:cilia- and flagella-associated protein 54-like isoform X2 [Biomphalaria glabrata]
MASILQNAAVSAVTKGLPSSYYTRDDRPNPVFQALDQEINLFTSQFKKDGTSRLIRNEGDESKKKLAGSLFEIWNKYEPRLPVTYFQEKLLDIGDYLLSIKEYKLALWQCYEKYLKGFANINIGDTVDVDTFTHIYVPDGLKADSVSLTFRALLGKSICVFHLTTLSDPRLIKQQSFEKCLQVLSFLRLITQVMLPRESLCWLVYNGIIHIYTVARYLMPLGFSAKVLEYLLWASITMESSVPLLTVKYLAWRTTLYAAVCQCYYDCKADDQAEKFAKRGLLKINEISQLETLSCHKSSPSKEISLRSATLRMAVIVFKRSVFESRRKPKGVFRPRSRSNLKEVINLPWPRTPTEKLLGELFDGGSAQFLAILESLSNSNRRLFHPSPAASDSDPEILDVFAELLMAAQEILAGGAGNNETGAKAQMLIGNSPLATVVDKGSLVDIATRGGESIPLQSVIKLLKLTYSYEHFDVFEILLGPVLQKIKECGSQEFLWDERVLELLSAMCKLLNRKGRRLLDDESVKTGVKPSSASVKSVIMGDELLRVADCLLNIVQGQYEKDKVEVDIVVDAALFLWSKCKAVFQKYQTGSVDTVKYLNRMDNPNKLRFSKTNLIFEEEDITSFSNSEINAGWTYLLEVAHRAITWSNISLIDPVLTAEVVLRLAMVYESSAQLEIVDEKTLKGSRTTLTDIIDTPSESYQPIGASNLTLYGSKRSNKEQLLQARDILDLGLKTLSEAAQAVALDDGESLADVDWMKEHNFELFASQLTKREDDQERQNSLSGQKISKKAMWNTVKDLFLELTIMYHRVCLKLSAPKSVKDRASAGKNKSAVLKEETDGNIKDLDELSSQCNKNLLSKALLYAQKSVHLAGDQSATQEQRKLLEEAINYVQRVQKEEKKIYSENTQVNENDVKPSKLPPPPVLLFRSATCMEFKPAPFNPESGERVAYYSIYARCATGPNVKARLSDSNFPGTDDRIPASLYGLKVCNLQPNERYLFAVAAYTDKGKLIGDGIGASTRPLLASQPLSILMCWASISQTAYQVGCYDLAKQACGVLWDYFVTKPKTPESETYITERKQNFKLTLSRLNQVAAQMSSPILLRHFLTSIFIQTEIAIREGQLYCDVVCDRGALSHNQVRRLKLCQNMLVAVELAGWLNEPSLALQAVVQIYGLLAPILFHKIPSLPVIQILQRCHAVLQEIPSSLIQRRHGIIGDGLNHMIACITFRMGKTLKSWGQNALADNILEEGKRLLKIEPESKVAEINMSSKIDESSAKDKKPVSVPLPKPREDKKESENEELRALEAHILSLQKAAASEFELSGSENPSILHSYIAFMPSSQAYKEVLKFKKRNRYLEFLVQVTQKGFSEGLTDEVQNWCDDGLQWINKRNETFIGPRAYMDKQPGAVIGIGDDPKKFAAAMVEYGKKKETGAAEKSQLANKKAPAQPVRKTKYKPLNVHSGMNEVMRQRQEEMELLALEKLTSLFLDTYRAYIKSKKFRNICAEELPWRSQLNLTKGLSHFNSLLVKLEKREKILGQTNSVLYRSDFLDPEWFTLETAGVIIIDREGAQSQAGLDTPISRGKSLVDSSSKKKSFAAAKLKVTGIELAATVVTGAEARSPSPINFIEETPRTYRSDISERNKSITVESLSSIDIAESLRKAFNCFKKAMVLAHRGQHWTLLQNAARSMWDCAQSALLKMYTADQTANEPVMLTMSTLRSVFWQPFYVAADYLLDMMVSLQEAMEKRAARARSKTRSLGQSFESWVGDVKSEYGGASLKFDPLLDDTNILDMRWTCRLVLMTLELLYLEEKWEKLVDIAMRFCALTNNRYAEQVIPLIIQAQRLLEARINEAGGPKPPQPQFQQLQAQIGHVVQFKDYLKSQLKVVTDKSKVAFIYPGSQIDPIGHGTYTKNDALLLSCVPLDIDISLKTFRETLSQSHYTARALQHSRKLLCLYLAGLQNAQESASGGETTRVDFKLAPGQPHPPMPPDKNSWNFSTTEDILVTPIGKSQLGNVISSYEKTIELLNSKHQKSLTAQAMHELGNIYFHARNTKAAFKWWCQALDSILNMNDALHSWRDQLQDEKDISRTLLDRCGLWGCVLAAVLVSNIAQYILTVELGLRIESCLLSGYLFKALFRASLPHPVSDRDYAMYNVGQGCEVEQLVPGIDFMSDRFRCDGRQLVAALKYVTEELSRSQHNLFVLPLLTLYQYFTTYICRDLQRSVDCRILRLQVLTELKFFSEAILVLQRLLNGERLPQNGGTGFRPIEKQASILKFLTDKLISDPRNSKVIGLVLEMKLTPSLSILFGPHLTCQLSLAHAHLLSTIASTLPVLPQSEEMILYHKMDKHFTKTFKLSTFTTSQSNIKTSQKPEESDATAQQSLIDGSLSNVLEDLKANLLSGAEQIVNTLADIIKMNAEQEKQGLESMSAAELEIVIRCKLEQAYIARQRHHAPLAARRALSALKLIQKAAILQPRKPQPPPPRADRTNTGRPSSMKDTQIKSARKYSEAKLMEPETAKFQYQNLQARSRLDARLWLQCRLDLISSLLLEIRGMGEVKDQSNKSVSDLVDCRQYCVEGIREAEVCGDKESQAHFYFYSAQLNILEGKSLEHTISLIENALELLNQLPQLSTEGKLLLVTSIVLKADLQASTMKKSEFHISTEKILQVYLAAQKIILKEMEDLGEKVEHYFPKGQLDHHSSPISPIQNIYFTHLPTLSQVKLRIGHTLTRIAVHKIKNENAKDSVSLWNDCLGVLQTALELSQTSAWREASSEAEILLLIGRCQRMLVYQDKFQASAAVNTLLDAIKTSYFNDHDLGLIRQAYLEIAMIYLYSSGFISVTDGNILCNKVQKPESVDVSSTIPDKKVKRQQEFDEKSRISSARSDKSENEDSDNRRGAYLALRCACMTSAAQRARNVLVGDSRVTVLISDKADSVPEFFALDLLSSYVLGEKKQVFKNEIEEELSTMIEAQEVKVQETYEEQVNRARVETKDLSWIHLLGYQSILQRLMNTSTCSLFDQKKETRTTGNKNEEETVSEKQPMNPSQNAFGINYNVIRYMLNSGVWSLRLTQLHKCLTTSLRNYASECSSPFPPANLSQIPIAPPEVNSKSKSYYLLPASKDDHQSYPNSISSAVPLPPTSNLNVYKPPDRVSGLGVDMELSVQWFYPSMVEVSPISSTDQVPPETQVLLLHALLKKGSFSLSPDPGIVWLSLQRVTELHDKLVLLVQKAEISLEDIGKETTPSVSQGQAKTKKSQRGKAASPKVSKDEELENLLKECVFDIYQLFTKSPNDEVPQEIPFEVSKANIKALESIFDLSLGMTIKASDLLLWLTSLLRQS